MIVERRKSVKRQRLHCVAGKHRSSRTFCFTPFALIRPSPEKHPFPPPFATTPTLRQPHSPFTLFLSEILERRRWPTKALFPPAPFPTLRPTPSSTDRSPPSFSRKPPPPRAVPLCLPFASFRQTERKKKEPGKRKERKEGMSWLERGESFRGRWFLPSLSLSRARSNRVSTRWCSRIGFTVHLVYREERNCTSLSI